jgi:hypothetical protein
MSKVTKTTNQKINRGLEIFEKKIKLVEDSIEACEYLQELFNGCIKTCKDEINFNKEDEKVIEMFSNVIQHTQPLITFYKSEIQAYQTELKQLIKEKEKWLKNNKL